MQDTDSIYERSGPGSDRGSGPAIRRQRSILRRLVPLYIILLALLLAALLLPLFNVNRFQRRIVTSLSESLGRPIHLDRISLTVLPLPGLTIENFVVAEDPAFGAEPFVQASTVTATLRLSSLWRRRIEFTRISFAEPHINLVRTSDGKWNLESILLQAARLQAAPTVQTRASATPRFPYIEATGARINLKLDQEKTPLSLTEAEFALWLPDPREWRLRLNGRPVRTDTSVSDTGILQVEGTLGRAVRLNDVPVDLKAEWRNAPLGEASRVVLGHDAGLRGTMTLATLIHGTVGQSALQMTLHLADLRRADFVPLHTLSIDAECLATESDALRSISDLSCAWPPALDPAPAPTPATVALTGTIPDTHRLAASSFDLGTPGIPAATLLDWLHIASARVSPAITATGSLMGSLALRPAPAASAPPRWSGQLTLANGSLTVPSVAAAPVYSGALILRAVASANARDSAPHSQIVLAPISLTLGGRDFATLDGRFDAVGYTLHLTGTALASKLLALGEAIPQIGDGLAEVLPPAASLSPTRFDLTSTRSWGSPQYWEGSRSVAIVPRHLLHH